MAVAVIDHGKVGYVRAKGDPLTADTIGFGDLFRFILGDTGVPYNWEYGDSTGKS